MNYLIYNSLMIFFLISFIHFSLFNYFNDSYECLNAFYFIVFFSCTFELFSDGPGEFAPKINWECVV